MAESRFPEGDSEPLAAGSEVMFDIVCYPCNNAGEIHEAEGYCMDCREHMCATCLKCHAKMSLTKHHDLVDKDNMPGKQTKSRFSDICTQLCNVHKDEVINFYCSVHKALGCGDCMVSNHDTCQGKVHIPDEAKNLSNSKEFTDFHATIESLANKSDIILKSSQGYIEYLNNCLQQSIKDIDGFRQEINDVLDKLQVQLKDKAEEIVAQETTKIATVVDDTNKVNAELRRLSSETADLLSKKRNCQLFINMKTSEKNLTGFQQFLEKAETSRITGFKFNPSEDLQKLLSTRDAFGDVVVMTQRNITTINVSEINIRARGNEKTPIIDGLAVLCKGKMAIVDSANTAVKLVYTTHTQILSKYKTEKTPYDVTTVSSSRVAVTVPDAMTILLLNAENTLSLDKELQVNQQCGYIAFVNGKFVVSFYSDPPSVGLLSMTGELLLTFSASYRGEELFNRSLCVTASGFSRTIYVSDWQYNRVLMINLDGEVMADYQNDDLSTPFYTVVDDLGMVYVCDLYSNKIHVLTPECRKVKILQIKTKEDKMQRSICYCKDTGRLYIGMSKSDIIKVFELA